MRNSAKILSFVAALFLAPAVVLAGEATVEVGHGTFEPATVTIKAGEGVVFHSVEKMPGGHTIVFDELDARSSGLGQGESWSHTFEKPGTYRFRVKEHPDNAGEVIVQPGG